MTEQLIREVAKQHGLDVLKRITAGTDHAHFATFELSGERIHDARGPIHKAALRRTASIQYSDVPGHPDFGKPFIAIESVWCEVA